MKLSDIRGKRSLSIMADAMELAELMSDDADFKAMASELKEAQEDQRWLVFMRHAAKLLRNGEYADRIISILAAAADADRDEYAENGPVLQDLFELFLSDAESLGFLAGSVAAGKQAG